MVAWRVHRDKKRCAGTNDEQEKGKDGGEDGRRGGESRACKVQLDAPGS